MNNSTSSASASPDGRAWPPTRRQILIPLAVALVYLITARLGLLLAMPGGHVTPVWPPSGLALAVMLLYGRRVWPGIWLGSFAANLWDFLHGPTATPLAVSILTAAGIGGGATLTAWVGAELLRRYAEPGRPLERVRNVCAFMSLGGVVSCLVSATNGVAWLALGGFAPWSAFGQIWLTWWLGDTAGVFLVTPLLLAWLANSAFPRRVRWWEVTLCYALLLVATYSVFIGNTTALFSGKPFTFVLIPFLVWPALRFGQRGAATAACLIACISVWGTIHGSGPFHLDSLNESLLVLELFLSVVALTALSIAAVVTEQHHAENGHRQVLDELESRVAERTAALDEANAALRESEQRLRTIIETEPECVKVISPKGVLLDMNRAGLAMLDAASLAELNTQPLLNFIAPEHQTAFRTLHQRVMAGGSGALEFETLGLKGTRRWLETHAVPLRDAAGQVTALLGVTRDVTERKRAEALINGQKAVLEMVASGAALPDTLTELVRLIESQVPGMFGSILLLDEDEAHVHHGAAPSLPPEFVAAIDGQPIGPCAGSCGTAVYRKQPVLVEDIANDPLWAEYKAVALPHGLRACWSTPIFDAQRRVIGTFAMYYRQPGLPQPAHLRLIEIATGSAAICISRHRAEAALSESEERLRLALDAARMGTFDWDVPRDRIVWSRGHEQLWGFNSGEFGGTYESFAQRLHPDDLPDINAEIARCIAGRAPFSREFRVVWPDGSVHWIAAVGEFTFDATGQPVRMRGAVLETTDRRRAEEDLRASELRHRLMAEIIAGFAFAYRVSPDRKVTLEWATSPITQVTGYSEAELKGGISFRSLIHPDDRASQQAALERVLGGSPELMEFRITTKSGAVRWLQCFNRPEWSDAEQRVVRILGATQDITARKEAEAAVRAAGERLELLSRRLIEVQEAERRHLARELHDEIGQTLTAAKINLQALQRFPDPASLPARLEKTVGLVDVLLQDVRKLSLNLRPPMLDDLGLVAGLRWLLNQRASSAGLQVRFEHDAFEERLEPALETACFRVAQEALTNVIRHARAKNVFVELRREPDGVSLLVRDDGGGFVVAGAQERAARGGSLGLLGMEERAALLGGSVRVKSARGKGTDVRGWFPLNQEKTT